MAIEDHLNEEEYDKLLLATTTSVIIAIVAGAVVFVTTCIVLLATCRRKTFRSLPRIVQLCMVMYIWQVALNLAIQIALLIKYPMFWDSMEKHFWQVLNIITSITWRMLMWHFAAHYMKTASLFKKTFQARQDQDFEKIQRQKMYLLVLEWGFQSIQILLTICTFVYLGDATPLKWNMVSIVIDSATILIISLVAIVSFNHIHKHSAAVEQLGITTNANIIRYQAVLWSVMFFSNVLNSIWFVVLKVNHRYSDIDSCYSQLMIQTIWYTVIVLVGSSLQMLVLYTYYLMSKRLSSKAAKLVANSLSASSRTSESIQVDGQELQDQRRMIVYRKSANRHMRHVVDTMMTLKRTAT